MLACCLLLAFAWCGHFASFLARIFGTHQRPAGRPHSAIDPLMLPLKHGDARTHEQETPHTLQTCTKTHGYRVKRSKVPLSYTNVQHLCIYTSANLHPSPTLAHALCTMGYGDPLQKGGGGGGGQKRGPHNIPPPPHSMFTSPWVDMHHGRGHWPSPPPRRFALSPLSLRSP